jgi:hypothetical protein
VFIYYNNSSIRISAGLNQLSREYLFVTSIRVLLSVRDADISTPLHMHAEN